MIKRAFSLVPFPAPTLPAIAIAGNVSFEKNRLDLQYSLSGAMQQILLPPKSPRPQRRDELWKLTCFEFFLAITAQPEYWEFNLSPSGDWNVYRMDAYRRIGFREETAVSQLAFETKQKLNRFSLNLSVDVAFLPPSEQKIQMGVTAIIQAKDGAETYWALTHPAPAPDFHRRESFLLELAEQSHPAHSSAAGD